MYVDTNCGGIKRHKSHSARLNFSPTVCTLSIIKLNRGVSADFSTGYSWGRMLGDSHWGSIDRTGAGTSFAP